MLDYLGIHKSVQCLDIVDKVRNGVTTKDCHVLFLSCY